MEVWPILHESGGRLSSSADIEDLLRELAPQVLGALLRRHQALDLCEDAVQEALLAAATGLAGGGHAR